MQSRQVLTIPPFYLVCFLFGRLCFDTTGLSTALAKLAWPTSLKCAVQFDFLLFFVFRYGYRGKDCRNNLYVLKSGEIIYFTAAVVVIYDVDNHSQRHYTEHTDDIKR